MATCQITSLLENLKLSVESDTLLAPDINRVLQQILSHDDPGQISHDLVEEGILIPLVRTLQNGNEEDKAKAAELLAELAKIEHCRIACVMNGVVPYLVENMGSENTSVALHACRALGNICFEYVFLPDGGRLSVQECGGAKKLSVLLQRVVDLPYSKENYQLQLVATGFLLNLLNSIEISQTHADDSHLIDVISRYLDNFAEDEDIPTHVLLSLSCLADAHNSRDHVVSRNFSPQLVAVLTKNSNCEVIETCLELIGNLAENENVRTQFATGGVCEAIMYVVQKHLDEPIPEISGPIIKIASDLIVLILVGDDSMGVLYDNGNSKVFKQLVEWLSSDLDDLQVSGALAIGNFARTDANCIQMVKDGIATKLVTVLCKHNTQDGDIRLQHALVSALRNLSIATNNKKILIDEGILDVTLPMIESIETYPVVFKLLACLRMIVDGQSDVANRIGEKLKIIQRFVEWSAVQDHPGVQGEASRILAWIIKNSDRTVDLLNVYVEAGALQPLVIMLGSEHAIMVNEAGLALALIFAKKTDAQLFQKLAQLPFIEKCVVALKTESHHPEVLSNIISAMIALTQSGEGRKLVATQSLLDILDSVGSRNEDLKKLTQKLLEKIKN